MCAGDAAYYPCDEAPSTDIGISLKRFSITSFTQHTNITKDRRFATYKDGIVSTQMSRYTNEYVHTDSSSNNSVKQGDDDRIAFMFMHKVRTRAR